MRLLFTSGTARGGTNFRTLMLNSHPQIQMSLDPFIPLFRFYRDSLLRENSSGLSAPSGVLDDYYFSNTKLKIMKTLQNANPDIPFDMSQWEQLKIAIASRMNLASMNLIPHLDKLPAPTFRETFYNTMKVVASGTDKSAELVWTGFNDNWAMEFFPLIAQLIPEAKFMLHLRDPRAVVFSSEFAEPDPAKRPTVISFARHLRKYAAFASVLPGNPHLQKRLMVTRYESFIQNPEVEVRRMTNFLGIEYNPQMIDIGRFRKADGKAWPSDWEIYKTSDNIWRKDMPRDMAELTEFVCDPDMRLHGYQPEIYDPSVGLSRKAFEFALRNSRECLGWRTDFAEIEQTIGSELYRKQMLKTESEYSKEEIERCFLFPEVYRQVQQLDGVAHQKNN
ncbi:MAG: sulfotransferase [Methylotenera sp.]|nr:sulfotransferase [Methylotenera sp.]